MNKPVAWIEEDGMVRFDIAWASQMQGKEPIPLYTHPVKELTNIVVASATCSCGKVMEVTNLQPVKELTDEEIWKTIIEEMGEFYDGDTDVYELCKAILRKAQEKN